MTMKKIIKKSKKLILILGFSALIIFTPLQISRLYSSAEEVTVMDSAPEFQTAQVELQALSAQEQKLNQELADLDKKTEIANSSETQTDSPADDPAIAPGKVKLKILLENKTAPNFSVSIRFVAVGDKTFETKTDSSGQVEIKLTSGRYYAEIVSEDAAYQLKGDGPAFFLNAGEEKDLGAYYLAKK